MNIAQRSITIWLKPDENPARQIMWRIAGLSSGYVVRVMTNGIAPLYPNFDWFRNDLHWVFVSASWDRGQNDLWWRLHGEALKFNQAVRGDVEWRPTA